MSTSETTIQHFDSTGCEYGPTAPIFFSQARAMVDLAVINPDKVKPPIFDEKPGEKNVRFFYPSGESSVIRFFGEDIERIKAYDYFPE